MRFSLATIFTGETRIFIPYVLQHRLLQRTTRLLQCQPEKLPGFANILRQTLQAHGVGDVIHVLARKVDDFLSGFFAVNPAICLSLIDSDDTCIVKPVMQSFLKVVRYKIVQMLQKCLFLICSIVTFLENNAFFVGTITIFGYNEVVIGCLCEENLTVLPTKECLVTNN